MSKARPATRSTPPRERSSADIAIGGAPPVPPPDGADDGRRPRPHVPLVVFNGFAIVVVMAGGLWCVSLLPPQAGVARAILIAAILLMVLAAILIPPAYLGGWIDRPAPRKESDAPPPTAPGPDPSAGDAAGA